MGVVGIHFLAWMCNVNQGVKTAFGLVSQAFSRLLSILPSPSLRTLLA